jgi:hypothetical protein
MKSIIFSIVLLIISSAAFSGDGSGFVTRIYAHEKDNGNGVIMFATQNHTVGDAKCSSSEWAFDAHNDHGKAMYALLLSAAAQGKTVIVSGKGTCDAWGDRESPSYIYVNY